MNYDEPAPPKSNTGLIIGSVFGGALLLFCCCGGMAWWGFRSASSVVGDVGGALAEMNSIGMAITTRYQVQASVGINIQSNNGVSTRTWTITMAPSAFDALSPEAKHAQALEIAAFARANAGSATPPTHICVVFGPVGVQDCVPVEALANVPVPTMQAPVPAPPVPAPTPEPAAEPSPPKQ